MKRRDLFKYAVGIAAVAAAPKLLAAPKAEPVSAHIRDHIREIVWYSIADDAYLVRFDIIFVGGLHVASMVKICCEYGPPDGRHYRRILNMCRFVACDVLGEYVAQRPYERLAPKLPLPDGYTPPTWWRA